VTVSIEEYAPAHETPVMRLWEERLGESYPDREKLDQAVDPDSRTFGLVGLKEDTVVGFTLSQLLDPEEVATKLRREQPPPWATDLVGLLDTGCVAKSVAGRGLASQMLSREIALLHRKGATCLLAITWIRPDSPDGRTPLEAAGFDHLETIDRYWYEESLSEDYYCPDCGQPCTCSAGIYLVRREVD
jgi:hypothetical protein